AAARALEGGDHVEHRVADARAQVDGEGPVALEGVLERREMPAGEVHDMDVVAHARAVVRGIVAAEDRQRLATADGDLRYEGHQVVGNAPRILADQPARMRPGGIEVAQDADRPA